MSDEIAPFEDEPLTVEEALEQLETAIRTFNTAINAANGLPYGAIAHWACAVDERIYTDEGVLSSVCILEPPAQPEYLTAGLMRAAVEQQQFASVEYDPDQPRRRIKRGVSGGNRPVHTDLFHPHPLPNIRASHPKPNLAPIPNPHT